ncbi:sigma-70 family RNA polymerase sigma factor [Paralimibaculum aggregatum]|uniref:Sigma-70 family RNA polymerase sigma factor n=1 Tax=Paralimibaculum aggregatum TaxID=3036245 RepID=A0ABQ6LQ73_9RHOB|nr:RNA polymerase sigma factor [Limibaculum sp. NKW23]GMG84665.1 sigma-70 family RNA polymerase sigma factor [Limibaculum sp. NKW23]
MTRPPEDTDTALLAATARGDRTAFERLFRRYHGPVFGFALRLTGRPDLADEVVGDTMMTVWRKAEGFEGRAKPSTWIFGIAYRVAAKARGRRAKDSLHDELDDQFPAARSGTEAMEAVFDAKAVRAALATLPVEQRATVELTYFYGYRLTEIAEITDCPVGTVKTRMFHARAKLRALLGGDLGPGEVRHG